MTHAAHAVRSGRGLASTAAGRGSAGRHGAGWPRDHAGPRRTPRARRPAADAGVRRRPGRPGAARRRHGVGRGRAPGRGPRAGPRAAGAGRRAFTRAPGPARRRRRGRRRLRALRLIELHAFNTAGDAAVAISLAGTLFFQVPTGEARGQVALFLGLTMLPFAIVAPLIGPFLDRFSHGRRWAIGATMAVRAFLCWVLAAAVVTGSTLALPRRARRAGRVQGVRRDAGRRRTPPGAPRLHAGQGQRPDLAGRHRRAPRCRRRSPALAATFGPEWSLRYAFVLFVVATILRDPAARAGRLQPGRGRARPGAGPRAAAATAAGRRPRPRDPARRSRSRCAPTAGRGGCRGS